MTVAVPAELHPPIEVALVLQSRLWRVSAA